MKQGFLMKRHNSCACIICSSILNLSPCLYHVSCTSMRDLKYLRDKFTFVMHLRRSGFFSLGNVECIECFLLKHFISIHNNWEFTTTTLQGIENFNTIKLRCFIDICRKCASVFSDFQPDGGVIKS